MRHGCGGGRAVGWAGREYEELGDPGRLGARDHAAPALRAADRAEHVLPHFEQRNPGDDRPRKAVEAGRAWARGALTMTQARAAAFVAHSAARDADGPAARAAARAAGHAVATAHVPGHAATCTATAATHAARATGEPGAASSCKAASTAATAAKRDWQYRRLPGHLRQVAFPVGKAT
ncbi:putative immunity protein [Streptomyces sp. NPDC048473]|uniref:putative immunity protein n=1 Tax=unclassified Streptomyces TaxID=2593676 RepID=UPI00372049D3